MSNPTTTTPALKEQSFTANKEFLLKRGRWHSFALNGDGIWQFWDGGDWVDYDEGTPAGKNFQAKPGPGGRVRLKVNAGTVVASFELDPLAAN